MNVTNDYYTALGFALREKKHKCIELLLEAGADVSGESIVDAAQIGSDISC